MGESEWEYLSIVIQLKEIKGRQRVWVLADEPTIEGMHNILNYYGGIGFELVTVTSEFSKDVGNSTVEAIAYRAFFKRPKRPETA